ncbi:MAG TPA: CHAD domain-containing protein [Gaiellaceae bacterium]|jgi:hypothetical protein
MAVHAVEHHYDTTDRDLEALGMTIARLPSEAGVVWRLTLPRGEAVEAWEAGTEGLSPPDEILELVGSVVSRKELVPAAPLPDDPGAKRLRELLVAQRRALLAHDPGVRVSTDRENLHQHRVAARRSRAFLRAARAYVDSDWRLRRDVERIPLEKIARREFARLAQAVSALGKSPADDAIHSLRISLKRARYTAELGGSEHGRARRFLAAAGGVAAAPEARRSAVER